MFRYKRAICYSGYRENQSPITRIYPSYDEVKEDLLLLEKDYDYIRMYDPYNHAKTVLECIRKEKINLKVMLGMDLLAEYNNKGCPWMVQDYSEERLLQNKKYNDNSLLELISLANEYEDEIIFLSAGNEALPSWGDNLVSNERVVHFVRELKKKCKQPVSYCEGWDVWVTRMDDIIKEVDFLSVHIYPMWVNIPINEAVEFTISKFEEVIKYTDKPVIITEMGWATCCNPNQMITEDANVECQRRYINGINQYLKDNDKLGFFFEAFDEPWKGGPSLTEAEKHWGLYYVDRTKKII